MIPIFNILFNVIQNVPASGRLRDYGPVYAETDLDHLVVEPWNGISSLAFLIPAFYWLWKFRTTYRQRTFYVYCALLLIVGGLGSTIYHLFRYYPFFIFMDFVPILILTFSVAVYLWNMLFKNPYKVGIITIVVFIIRYVTHNLDLDTHTVINIDYFFTGTFFFLPALLLLISHKFHGFSLFALSLLFLLLALLCRVIDLRVTFAVLPMGTHFLWHIFCAIGAFYLGQFIIKFTDYMISLKEITEED
ncbi:MAG TPA: hypothetical protein VL947_11230 [Cytophagales bacterium]|nr:hypothetical protein [Cytophagales bacterium]